MVHFYSYNQNLSYLENLIFKKKNKSQQTAFKNIFKRLDVKSFIVEDDYTDKDYLVDYTSYLARCFFPYDRLCKRIHFFKGEITKDSFHQAIAKNDSEYIKSLQDNYVGYMVIRPIEMAKIGKTCLQTYPDDNENGNHRRYPACKKYHVNLMGIPLYVTSLAFQEQDQNVAMCSSIALWSALQKTGRMFQHIIPTPSEITSYALSYSPHITKFPNQGLNVEQICVCISNVGLNNFLHKPSGEQEIKAIVRAYLNLGIPIIAALTLYDKNNEEEYSNPLYHAVTIGGYSYGTENRNPYSSLSLQLFSSKITRLFCHDDQLCPFSKLKFISGCAEKNNYHLLSTSWLNNDNGMGHKVAKIDALIVPIYHKIRISYHDIYKYIMSFEKNLIHTINNSSNSSRINSPSMLELINIEWDITLNLSNHFKSDILQRSDLSDSYKIQMVEAGYPKYIWCAKASIYVESGRCEVFELIFDATDIKNGDNLIRIVVYDKELFRFYLSIYIRFYEKYHIDDDQKINLFNILNNLQNEYYSQ